MLSNPNSAHQFRSHSNFVLSVGATTVPQQSTKMTSISRLELPHLSLLHPPSSTARIQQQTPCGLLYRPGPRLYHIYTTSRTTGPYRPVLVAVAPELFDNAASQPKNGAYVVGDFMTRKEELLVVKSTTTVDEALKMLVENRITGFPVIDDDWNLVGLVSDYDLLALDSVSGTGRTETDMFPEVDSTWKTFNEVQKLLSKTNGQLVGDLMTPTPVVVHEATNLEHAARLLLETKYRRLPVVDDEGKLVGIITRGNVVRAALQIKQNIETT